MLLVVGPEVLDHIASDFSALLLQTVLRLLAQEVYGQTIAILICIFITGAHLHLSSRTIAGHQG